MDERSQRPHPLAWTLPRLLPAQSIRRPLGRHALGARDQRRPGALRARAGGPGAGRALRDAIGRRGRMLQRQRGGRRRHADSHLYRHLRRPQQPGPVHCHQRRRHHLRQASGQPRHPRPAAPGKPRRLPRPEGLAARRLLVDGRRIARRRAGQRAALPIGRPAPVGVRLRRRPERQHAGADVGVPRPLPAGRPARAGDLADRRGAPQKRDHARRVQLCHGPLHAGAPGRHRLWPRFLRPAVLCGRARAAHHVRLDDVDLGAVPRGHTAGTAR